MNHNRQNEVLSLLPNFYCLPGKPPFVYIPHCPNPKCDNFKLNNSGDTSWFKDHGFYDTNAFGIVPRFRCNACGKTFSTQTFRMDYYVKKPVDYKKILKQILSTSGQGNLSRFEGWRWELIQNRLERLSRFFLALHSQLRKEFSQPEDFVLDGFESFSVSQFYPNNVNILVGSASEMIYGMGFAQLRRKGRMSDEQKLKRKELEKKGKAPGSAVEISVTSLLKDLCSWLKARKGGLRALKSDEHQAYSRSLSRIEGAGVYLKHEQYSSKAPRTIQNPLFPVNYVDRQFRKDQVNHVRETVQFARCPSAMMTRLTVYQGYHNYLMPRRIRSYRKHDYTTRAELLGVRRSRLIEVISNLWGRRIFLHKLDLWEEEKVTWFTKWRNKGIEMGRREPYYIRI